MAANGVRIQWSQSLGCRDPRLKWPTKAVALGSEWVVGSRSALVAQQVHQLLTMDEV